MGEYVYTASNQQARSEISNIVAYYINNSDYIHRLGL